MQPKNEAVFAQAVREMREQILPHLEYQQLQARILRAKYLALVEHGFSEDQALSLCKT